MNTRARKYQNPTCQACIRKNIEKYGEFNIKCDGITIEDDVKFAMKHGGVSEEDARWAFDPCYFFEQVYGSPPRAYQVAQLQCTSRRITGRQCRQSGKSLAYIYKVIHYLITNENKTVLVIAPFEKLLKKLWDEYVLRDCLYKTAKTKASIANKSMSPSYNITFDNQSRLIMMIAGEGARGQTADWIYIDEAAIIPPDTLNSIIFTIASRGDGASMLLTSTPKGRGNMFYKACKEDSSFNEYHVSIYDIPEMVGQVEEFRRLSNTEADFEQECVAEFPDTAGGPFSYKGIDMAKQQYLYAQCTKEPGCIYFGGVDWNGPGVGTYFYIVAFNPEMNTVRVVDKSVISSNQWNSTAAKSELIKLNRKWNPKHWMCDAGYGHSIIEDLRLYSLQIKANNSPDAQIKYSIEPVAFGEWVEIKDPFTKEDVKKTTKSFVVSQVARLFEPLPEGGVNISYSSDDLELTRSLETYKLLNTTAKGVEQFGFDKKDGIEDHCIDALMLAIYGIVKYYGELFKRIIYQSVGFNAKDILTPPVSYDDREKIIAGSIILLTDNSPEPIFLDEKSIRDPFEDQGREIVVSRSIGVNNSRRAGTLTGIMSRRGTIVRRNTD